MRIDPITLKIFLTIVEEGNQARAAERHFMATSAVSKRISDLEDTLGVQLFERHSMGVRPTPAGIALVEHAKSMMSLMSKMQADMSGFGDGGKGEIRVFSNSTAIVAFLGGAFKSFFDIYPDVSIRLEEWSSPFIVRSLRDGVADIGIFWSGVSTTGLTVVPYRSARLVVLVPEYHSLAVLDEVDFAQTLAYDYVAFHEGSQVFRMMQSCAADLGRKVNVRLQVTSFDAMRATVQSGIGIAMLSDVTVINQNCRGLKVLRLKDDWARMDSFIGYRDMESLPRCAQNLVRFLNASSNAAASQGDLAC